MPREVRHEDGGPYLLTEAQIDDEKGDIAVCRCGLSPAFPFCDGSHRATRDEDPATCYRYPDGPDGDRRVLGAEDGAPRGVTGDDPTPDGSESPEDGAVAVHEAQSPRIVDPEELADAGGQLCLRLSDLATDVCDGSGRDEPDGER